MIDRDLEDFGRTMGIEGLSFRDASCLKLAIENGGDVYLQKVDEYLLFYILKRVEERRLPSFCWEVLRMAYAQEAYPFFVHPVMFLEDQIGFSVRLRMEICDLPTLTRVFRFLKDQMKKLESSGGENIK
ncbi:MAG: hypothetical protein LBR62_01820 [Puniceicoccales bacterium]|jgi:type III secretion system chaperone SycN|nr:hypothetical protein [Puniceicoccales bacterium]